MSAHPDFYELRHTLQPGQVFRDRDGLLVQLDRRVPGDGTKWFVLDGDEGGRWYDDGTTIEPGDLAEQVSA